MALELTYQRGQTPLDEDEKEGLRIKSITTQGELNEAERLNIEQAIEWTVRRRFTATDILSEDFIMGLHKRMYGDVWRWAGSFRRSNKNIGVEWMQVPIALRTLIDDAIFWHQNHTFPPDEMAIRFKHRIVNIHCFPNGNGRHSRLMADVIISHIYGQPVFTWSRANLVDAGEARDRYLQAIWAADAQNIEPLLAFARY